MALARFLGFALVVVLLAGCVPVGFSGNLIGSGRTKTQEFDLAGFGKVEAGSAFAVEITQSDNYSVVVTVDDNFVDRLDVNVLGDTLHISLKSGIGIMGNATLKAKVTMPALTGLDLSGATRTTISGFSSEQMLDVALSGASTLRGDIKSGDARFNISGASKVALDGSADNLDLEISGASSATLDAFASKDTTVGASGASHVTVNVSGKLNAEASGASSVTYIGEPTRLTVNTSGASSVHQK